MRSVPGETLSNEYGSLTCFTVYSPSLVAVTEGFPRTPPGKSWIPFCKISRPGKSRKMDLVLESPGNFNDRSWKVLEFSRL